MKKCHWKRKNSDDPIVNTHMEESKKRSILKTISYRAILDNSSNNNLLVYGESGSNVGF
jgi:hypothetical protein